jgi:hypothetical protein
MSRPEDQCQLGNLRGREVLTSQPKARQSETTPLLPNTRRLHSATLILELTMAETLPKIRYKALSRTPSLTAARPQTIRMMLIIEVLP